MSRHFAFWKYEDGIYLENHKVYEEACCDCKNINGLSVLPINDILCRVNKIFDSYENLGEYNYESDEGSFTITVTEQTVLFECSWSMSETELNKIIDVMLEFDCPLYDPQISVRFDGS